jgi:putative transcriptional regulator
MIEIRIKEIAKERGMKNAHRLQLAAELSPAVAARLWKSEIEKISIETLARLCSALECQPGDLFVFVPDGTNETRKAQRIPCDNGV